MSKRVKILGLFIVFAHLIVYLLQKYIIFFYKHQIVTFITIINFFFNATFLLSILVNFVVFKS